MFQHSGRMFFFCAVAFALTTAHVGAQSLGIDLGRTKPGEATTTAVDPGTYTISFTNLLPGRAYIVSVQHHAIPIEPLPVTAIPWLKPPASPAERALADICPALHSATTALTAAVAEEQVAALADAVERALGAGCADTGGVDAAKALVARTAQIMTVSLGAGEEAVVEIQRGEIDKDHPAAQWTLKLSSGARGEWLTSYGFTIGANRDERYFSQASADNKFTVTRERDVSSAVVIPSIYFSWQSRSADRRNWAFSPTVGFGITKDAPSVMAGVSATFNRNIAFVAGVAIYQQTRLSGQYVEGQTISENLSANQLQRDVWKPGFVAGVTLRFGSNPFSTDSGGQKQKPGSSEPSGTTPVPPSSSAGGAKPAPAKPGGEASVGPAFSFSTGGHRLFFTESGDLSPDSTAARDALLAAAADATDVFILSHGWWNNPGTADCLYQQLVDGLRAHVPATLQRSFRPVVVGIYWPSVIFPTETGDCEPAVKTPQGAELMVQGSFESDLAAWASAAFPTAAQRPSFATERARAIQLLGQERKGERLTRAEAIELATLLDRWRRAAANADIATGDGPATELFSDAPTEVVDQWLSSVNRAGPAESFTLAKSLDFANAFTFWTMKARAGVVGSRGVFDLVHAVRERGGTAIRIHLIGHSFGARLLSAAVAGRSDQAPNQVDSLILLEGAFSHFAFATKDQIAGFGFAGDKGGIFQSAVASMATASPAVRGRLVAVFSRQDTPNQVLYPAAAKLKGSDREASRILRYGSIGADGFQGPAVTAVKLEAATSDQLIAALGSGTTRLYNVDATNVVRGHSDLVHDQVFDLIWSAVVAGGNQR